VDTSRTRPITVPESATRLCETLLDRWDGMFSSSIDLTRPRRTEAALKVVGARARGPFRVLELGSGPGAFAKRLLRRFPQCRVVAVDMDPVLLRVAERALRRYRGRTRWVLADVRESRWPSKLPVHRFDVVVSSLTLHWLEESEIKALYRQLRRLLGSGGILVEADYLPSERPHERHHGAAPTGGGHRRSTREGTDLRAFKRAWSGWWAAVAKEPTLRDALQERQLRMPGPIPPKRTTGPKVAASIEAHERALLGAGFRPVGVVWEDGAFRVLVGACPGAGRRRPPTFGAKRRGAGLSRTGSRPGP
jgi:SAM-dependent methyltransferase